MPPAESKRKRAAGTGESGSHAPPTTHRIPAGEFKALCLALMDRVKETGEEYVITKRGRAVAKLVRVQEAEDRPFVGRSRGMISVTREELLAPVDADWEVDADL